MNTPGGIQYPLYRLPMIGIGLVEALGMFGLISCTRIGIRIDAGESDRETIAVLGVDILRLFTMVSAFGAGLAGALVGAVKSVLSGMGEPVLILAFAVIVIGRIKAIKRVLAGRSWSGRPIPRDGSCRRRFRPLSSRC